ncbi:sigma 54-interacting transcriptional regulator [Sorangium sp. So ce131]|uniref:sigma 54-interacting transcriptional regulator n=1 Tax=Sorangium sp. So ce131 TaxID=3133282 RepID=UPI003F6004A1
MGSEPKVHPSTETALLKVRSREIAFSRFRVQVTAGPDAGAAQVSDATEFVIGTAPGNQLILSDRAVSRHHCVIAVTPKGFQLRDLGSKNGTTLAGFRVEAAYLQPGATLGVGQSTLRFEPLAEEIREPLVDEDRHGRVLGQSTAMRRIFAALPRIAASDSTVLIEGETGTGKGLLAEAIHESSPRAGGPFVVIDCGSIPPTLIEAELFGHAKGAFTGAQAARAGAFEAARGGTVLLDEMGELPLDMQPKLLRVLEERQIRRIGTVEPTKLDIRVIATTNRDLRQEVNRGNFRSDLYYRLNIVRLRVPALRERPDDIALLTAHFYRQFAQGPDQSPPGELLEAFMRQDWPGNVRELRGAVERAVLMIDPALFREAVMGGPEPLEGSSPALDALRDDELSLSFREAKERAVARWERAYLTALVRANGGNLSRAARAARMDRSHLRELLQRHGVSAAEV